MENTNRNKILVLIGLTENSVNVLKNALKMAEIIGGKLEIFHVCKPTSLVEKDNSLSAFSTIKDHYLIIENKIQTMISSALQDNQIAINHVFAFGHIKNEIKNHLESTKPDIVVMGKRKSRTPDFLGDKIIPFVFKNFKNDIMIVDDNNVLEAKTKLSLGLLNMVTLESNLKYYDTLVSNIKGPIRTFKVADSNNKKTDSGMAKEGNIISYEFEKNDQTLKTVSNYVDINKVNLLLLKRKSKVSPKNDDISFSGLNSLTQSFKVPVLFIVR